jgi:chitinase
VGASDAARKNFAASCVNMIKNYGFDGIDVDWEYPQDKEQGQQFLALLQEIRRALNAYADYLARDKGYAKEALPQFLLSIAAPAGADNYGNIPLREVAETLDFVNLMVSPLPSFIASRSNTSRHTTTPAHGTTSPATPPTSRPIPITPNPHPSIPNP